MSPKTGNYLKSGIWDSRVFRRRPLSWPPAGPRVLVVPPARARRLGLPTVAGRPGSVAGRLDPPLGRPPSVPGRVRVVRPSVVPGRVS